MSHRVSAAETLALLSAALFATTAAFADTPHFLSDQFALPTAEPAAPAKKLLYDGPNNHLERIPKCSLYFDYRQPGPDRVVIYRYSPMPSVSPTPKPHIHSEHRN